MDLSGKRCLDVGSGFGGVAIHLARKYDVQIVGVDRESYMEKIATDHLERHKKDLKGHISFHTLKNPTLLCEFADESFDIVYSKETFYHVSYEDKEDYLREIFRVLKPGGQLIMADWYQSAQLQGEHLKQAAPNSEACQFSTPACFEDLLLKLHYQHITYVDETEEHIRYTETEIQRILKNSQQIREELGEDTYANSLFHWGLWLTAQEHHELLSGIFFAERP
jgi:ubiquinone/menaquinone biosynthesis C-methylase UbiE